jgi:FkbM family methyltransferase
MYFDIGANIGNWSLENVHTADKIITIEASSSTFNRLISNVKNNSKIIPLNFAVCNNDGNDIVFYDAHYDDVFSTINKEWLTSPNSRFYGKPYREIMCKTITIDKLIETYGIPELIKIDVEGGEYGCISSLSQRVNHLCFEWASEVNDITFKCIDHLSALGFASFYLQMQDNYTFRPNPDQYFDGNTLKNKLLATKPKIDWGMIWCQ